jgi:hypothetical protein
MQRLRRQVRSQREESQSVDEPMLAALQARLEALEREIDRVTSLALKRDDLSKQEALLSLARDLQRDARAIREQILSCGRAALQGRVHVASNEQGFSPGVTRKAVQHFGAPGAAAAGLRSRNPR